MMANIRSRDTKPELILRSGLHRLGLRYRLNSKLCQTRPDLFFPKYRTAVFVNGCFWHRHSGCNKTTTPRTRQEFWSAKFAANVARDARNADDLNAARYRVAVVWACALERGRADETVRRLSEWITSDSLAAEMTASFE
jgi:DNA mismatch endonuclease (patch repair protein)